MSYDAVYGDWCEHECTYDCNLRRNRYLGLPRVLDRVLEYCSSRKLLQTFIVQRTRTDHATVRKVAYL